MPTEIETFVRNQKTLIDGLLGAFRPVVEEDPEEDGKKKSEDVGLDDAENDTTPDEDSN